MVKESDKTLQELFKLAQQDFDDYRSFDHWRYINGDSECGTTDKSRSWVRDNSERHCPACGTVFSHHNGRSIDHKLPRAQYPWLSLEFKNLWVICHSCNQEKGEMHWYEYEHFVFTKYPERYQDIVFARPRHLLKSLSQQ